MGWVLTGKGMVVRNPETLHIDNTPFTRFGLIGEPDSYDNDIEGKRTGCTVLWFVAIGAVGIEIRRTLKKRDVIEVTASVRACELGKERDDNLIAYVVTSFQRLEKGPSTYQGES